MPDIPLIRQLSKERYLALRKTVRSNIALNSQQAVLRKASFGEVKVLMGGIIVKKSRYVKKRFINEAMSISVSLSAERAEGYQSCLDLTEKPAAAEFEFSLYDFSGMFNVRVSWENQDRNLILRATKLKEGDVVYVIGRSVPINSPDQYFIIPSEIFYEDELRLCEYVSADKLRELKKHIQEIKNAPAPLKNIDDDLYYNSGWNFAKTLRLFLSEGKIVNNSRYYWLIECLYEFYRLNPSLKLAILTAKYFKRYAQNQIFENDYNAQDFFFDLCPELKGVLNISKIFD
jgi:hypothetical protein